MFLGGFFFLARYFASLVITGLILSGSPSSQTNTGASVSNMVSISDEERVEPAFFGRQHRFIPALDDYLTVTCFPPLHFDIAKCPLEGTK